MRTIYLTWSFTAFLAWMILEKMDNELKWVALGFGGMMLLIGLFMKEKVKPVVEEEINNLNKNGGKKNDI